MEHSKETIESIKKFIRKKEKGYIRSKKLVPITQTECAEYIGVHASTVSRIIKSDIKIKLGHKEYPLSFFFSQRKIHPQVFYAWINQVIEAEDPSKPISDNKLLGLFNTEFPEMKLRLRTIIKYRSKAGIDSGNARRRAKQHWLLKTVATEDPKNPQSDQMLAERFKKEHPQLNITEKQIENLRKRAGIKAPAKRRKKYVIT